MKTCTYCGRENEDAAGRCRECGTEFVAAQPVAEHASAPTTDEERLQRIAVLDNQVQAGLVDSILTDREIPHIMQTYHDSAYDGIFQTQGWGVVLAPASFRDEILTILQDIKQQSQS
ncbi:MAG: zinc ribbon domain-containing protein [Limisphaerales bacterium]